MKPKNLERMNNFERKNILEMNENEKLHYKRGTMNTREPIRLEGMKHELKEQEYIESHSG